MVQYGVAFIKDIDKIFCKTIHKLVLVILLQLQREAMLSCDNTIACIVLSYPTIVWKALDLAGCLGGMVMKKVSHSLQRQREQFGNIPLLP